MKQRLSGNPGHKTFGASLSCAVSKPSFSVVVGVAYWQYGGALSLLPAFTADFFGPKNLGLNYGLVFIGWGISFFVPLLAGVIADRTGSLEPAFCLSGGLLLLAVVVCAVVRRQSPTMSETS